MAITQVVNLPGQPGSGLIEFIPLGGDGFTSPKSAWYGTFNVTGDVSGGLISMTVNADGRFEHVVSFLNADIAQAAATGFRFSIGRKNVSVHTVGQTIAGTLTGSDLTAITYAPVAMIDATHWTCRVENTDGIAVKFKFLVYNFNIQASLQVPLSVLLASLPRAPTVV